MMINEMLLLIPEERRKANERECVDLIIRVRLEASSRLFATPEIRKQWMIDLLHFYLDYPDGITREQDNANDE
jgi:hypothetical protein